MFRPYNTVFRGYAILNGNDFVGIVQRWDKESREQIRAQLGMMKLEKYTTGRRTGWNIRVYRRYHHKELPHQPTGRCDPGRPRRRWPDGLTIDDGTGYKLNPSR
jgi:hypothetical protein